MNERLNPHLAFGDVIIGQIGNVVADYQRLIDQLRALTDRVPDIGQEQGSQLKGARLRPSTATDIALEALRIIQRETPNITGVVSAAADYDRDVPNFSD